MFVVFLKILLDQPASLPYLCRLSAVLYRYFIRGFFGYYPKMVRTNPEESAANVLIKQVYEPEPPPPQPH